MLGGAGGGMAGGENLCLALWTLSLSFDPFEVAVTTGGGRGLVMGDGGGRGLAGMAAAVGEEGDEECFGAEGGGREMATSDMMDV
jgi:hypothetical protein